MKLNCAVCGGEAKYKISIERVGISLCTKHAVNLMLSPKVLRIGDDSALASPQKDLDALAQLIIDNLESSSDFGVQVLIGMCMGVTTEARLKGVSLDETTLTKAIEAAKAISASKEKA